jgi:hypothetical protein
MTPLEEKIRAAIREKADQVPADAVPPLLLPVRRWRPFSLAYGGGQRTGAPAWRAGSLRWLAPAASAILVGAVIAGSVVLSRTLGAHPAGRTGPPASAASSEAAAWVAAQVGRSEVVSCDAAMCQTLKALGMPASDLEVLGRGGGSPLGSGVIVATAAVRRELGSRLSSVYAPVVIASFGSGSTGTQVRVIAPDGAAAYLRAFGADLANRKSSGRQLARSTGLRISAAATRELRAGQVDTRAMSVIASMADQFRSQFPVSILAFGDRGPGAAADVPLRSVELAGPPGASLAQSTSDVQQMLAFLQAQQPPFAAAWADKGWLAGGRPVLRVQFAAPSPLGLLADNVG